MWKTCLLGRVFKPVVIKAVVVFCCHEKEAVSKYSITNRFTAKLQELIGGWSPARFLMTAVSQARAKFTPCEPEKKGPRAPDIGCINTHGLYLGPECTGSFKEPRCIYAAKMLHERVYTHF